MWSVALGASVPSYGAWFTALVILALAAVAWRAVRRKSASAGSAILLAGALLIAGCFLPTPASETRARVHGTLTGDARFPVAGGRAPANASLVDGALVVSCPAGCAFALEDASLALDAAGLLTAHVTGGPLDVQQDATTCHRAPFTLSLLTGGGSCDPCEHVRFEAAASQNGSVTMKGARGAC